MDENREHLPLIEIGQNECKKEKDENEISKLSKLTYFRNR